MTTTSPPPFEPSKIELKSIADSKIIAVSLYSTRAEITRLFKFAVKTGQNQVHIAGLPNVLETESLRVEGRGAGEHVPTSSAKLSELLKTREKTASALTRCEKALTSLEQYLGSLTVQHLEVSHLDKVLEQYDSTGGRLDSKKVELTEELRRLDTEISNERALITVPHEDSKLRMQAAIGVFAESEGPVEIALIYAVPYATWTAFYDIRVNMDTKENPVTLIYKAAVKQSTGESWDDVPLQLETSTPTFGLGVPTLSPWDLNVYRPAPRATLQSSLSAASPPAPMARGRMRSVSLAVQNPEEPVMAYRSAAVTSKGNVSATFRVPGLVAIPCDGDTHNFTIVELSLTAAMSWVSVPKIDPKTHLNARITNASEYTLLTGSASVYVDGSFISRSVVPAVSPQESFDCPLGLDSSIRITYHPRPQDALPTATHVFSQRITVHNTKAVAIERLKVVDQIPASQDSQIEVKLVGPALTLAGEGGLAIGTSKRASVVPKPQALSVADGIVAQWDGADEPACDLEALGRDRKLNWICAVPAQGKINFALDWEVSAPANVQVLGL
ncbi:hypothetical protein B0H14DRAFT_2949554 [Mycena olivaceomarginata]|nr:hypothetical protein B0H14DRAFT_2949554 [Mycena olivaceomarginata]